MTVSDVVAGPGARRASLASLWMPRNGSSERSRALPVLGESRCPRGDVSTAASHSLAASRAAGAAERRIPCWPAGVTRALIGWWHRPHDPPQRSALIVIGDRCAYRAKQFGGLVRLLLFAIPRVSSDLAVHRRHRVALPALRSVVGRRSSIRKRSQWTPGSPQPDSATSSRKAWPASRNAPLAACGESRFSHSTVVQRRRA